MIYTVDVTGGEIVIRIPVQPLTTPMAVPERFIGAKDYRIKDSVAFSAMIAEVLRRRDYLEHAVDCAYNDTFYTDVIQNVEGWGLPNGIEFIKREVASNGN
jgi:hypothetical protein